VKVIRKLLTPNEVTPPSIRWNEGTDTVEQTPDGGETWVETPELDPRYGAGFRRPPLTGEDARCNAAARQAAAWEEVYNIFMESTDALQFLAIILQILLALAGGVGVLIGLIFLIFDALIFIGKENMEAQFSEEVWDEIMCIIYRNIGEDGQISEAQLSDIYEEIGSTYPGTVYNTLIEIGHLFGEVLLSNASVERAETGDCEDCPLCEPTITVWDFQINDQGANTWTWNGGEFSGGTYLDPTPAYPKGWYAATQSGANRIGLRLDIDCVYTNKIRLTVSELGAGSNVHVGAQIRRYIDDVSLGVVNWYINPTGVGNLLTIEGYWSAGEIHVEDVYLELGMNGTAGYGFAINGVELLNEP